MDKFTPKVEIQSLSARTLCCWESRRRLVVHETFWELHSETMSQVFAWTAEVDEVDKPKGQTWNGSTQLAETNPSLRKPQDPNLHLQSSGQVCASTSGRVRANTFSSSANVKMWAL